VLEDHSDIAMVRVNVHMDPWSFAGPRDDGWYPAEMDCAVVDLLKQADASEQSGFAAPARADDGDGLAFRYLQIHIVQRRDLAEPLRDALEA